MKKKRKFIGLLIYLIFMTSGIAVGYVILNQGVYNAENLGERFVAITESLMVCVTMVFFCYFGFLVENLCNFKDLGEVLTEAFREEDYEEKGQ